MDVKLVEKVGHLWGGTVIKDAVEVGDDYVGLWCSREGSYEVTVPKHACKVFDEAAEAAEFQRILANLRANGLLTPPIGPKDDVVRDRVLERFRLGRKTGAPIGAGNYTPGVRVLLVGEQTSHPEVNKYHAPFCSTKASSGWLNAQLCEAMIDEKDLFWINALDNDGSEVDLKALYAHLKPQFVFALGKVAERQLQKHKITYTAFAHPQYWKRFKSKDPYPLIPTLRICTKGMPK